MKSRTIRARTASRTAALESYMYGAIVVPGCIYYQARVLHDHPWRAADSTAYQSSQLIATSVSLGDMVHECKTATCFRVSGLRPKEPTTTTAKATYRSSVVVRTATPTHDLGQLRTLPRLVVHRAGASHLKIKNTISSLHLLARRMPCACSLFPFCQFFRAGVVNLYKPNWNKPNWMCMYALGTSNWAYGYSPIYET